MKGSLNIQTGGTVAYASQMEAETGTNNTKAMTPLRVAEAIAALGGGGSGGSTMTDILYVDAVNGNNFTADGSATKPYKTLQAAYNSGIKDTSGQGSRTFFIRGNVGNLNCTDGLRLVFLGTDRNLCAVGAITQTNATGDTGFIRTNGQGMVNIHSIELASSNGSTPESGWGGNGGNGRSLGRTTLEDCYIGNYIHLSSGAGGSASPGESAWPENEAGNGGSGGNGGHLFGLTLIRCRVGSVLMTAGNGGGGGEGGNGYYDDDYIKAGGHGGEGGNGGSIQGSAGFPPFHAEDSQIESVSMYPGHPGGGGQAGVDMGGGTGTTGNDGTIGADGSAKFVRCELLTDLAQVYTVFVSTVRNGTDFLGYLST